jgi:GNAT superfamily N-acetyltransferase
MPALQVRRSRDDLLMIGIAPAAEQDVPAILSLIKALAEYEHLSDAVVATEADLHRALFGPEPFAEVIVATDGEATVGFALFFHTFSTFLGRPGLYLEDLFVVPDRRGQGYGKALLAALARIAVDRGCGRFEWSVLDWNEAAIGFYRRMGAEVMDEWRICRVTGEALGRLAHS